MARFTIFLFLSLLLTLLRIGSSLPFGSFKDDFNIGARENYDTTLQADDTFDDIPRRRSACKNKFNSKFCKRFHNYCGHHDKNGYFMEKNCHRQCGCH